MKSNSQLPTIESVEKEFDEKFFYHGTVKKMIKSFYRQKLTEILEFVKNEVVGKDDFHPSKLKESDVYKMERDSLRNELRAEQRAKLKLLK